MVKSPEVVAYHPEIWVENPGDGLICQILMSFDDYYSDEEILGSLRAVCSGCLSYGDLVESVRGLMARGELGVSGPLLSVVVVDGGLRSKADFVQSWDELLD